MGTRSAPDPAPLPRLGEVFFDVRGSSRSMRLSWYADTGVSVFSIWQGGTCTGTFRLPMEELPRLIDSLQRGAQAHDPRGSGGYLPGAPTDPRLTALPGGYRDADFTGPVTGDFGAVRDGDPGAMAVFNPASPLALPPGRVSPGGGDGYADTVPPAGYSDRAQYPAPGQYQHPEPPAYADQRGQRHEDRGYAGPGYGERGYQEHAYADPGAPGYAGQVYAEQGYEGQGYDSQGYADYGYDGQGYQSQALAGHAVRDGGRDYAALSRSGQYSWDQPHGPGQQYDSASYPGRHYAYSAQEYSGGGYAEEGPRYQQGMTHPGQGYGSYGYSSAGYQEYEAGDSSGQAYRAYDDYAYAEPTDRSQGSEGQADPGRRDPGYGRAFAPAGGSAEPYPGEGYSTFPDPYGSTPDQGYSVPDHRYSAPDHRYDAPDRGYDAPDRGYGALDLGYGTSGYGAHDQGGHEAAYDDRGYQGHDPGNDSHAYQDRDTGQAGGYREHEPAAGQDRDPEATGSQPAISSFPYEGDPPPPRREHRRRRGR
jgi:hypothetical protein